MVGSSTRTVALASLLLLTLASLTLASRADAQSEASTTATTEPPTAAEPTADEASQGAIVFLLAADLPTAISAALVDALEAQLSAASASSRGVRVYVETMTGAATDMRAAIDQGVPSATKHNAAGVFWLDASGQDDWLLYLMDASAERVLARRMEAAAKAPSASIEAIAVIVRESAAALLAGQPIAMDPVAAPPTASTPSPAPSSAPNAAPPNERTSTPSVVAVATETEADPRLLRFGIGYSGSPLSTDVAWQHGLALQAALMFKVGLFVGLGYTLLPTLEVRRGDTELSLNRRPLRALFGLHHPLTDSFRLDLEAAAIVDITSRHASTNADTSTPSDPDTALLFGAGLAARINWTLQASLELYLSLGGELFFNRFDYVKQKDMQLERLLSPWIASPVAEIGIAFRP